MALLLVEPLKKRLIEQLAEELKNATVFSDCAISTWSLRGLSHVKSLPDKGEIAEQLRRFIGDDAFSTFITDELDSSFRGPGPDLDAEEKPLSDYEGYGDLEKLAGDLVETFTTLPWLYQLTIRLPSTFGPLVAQQLGDIVLSPNHRIVSGATLRKNFPTLERRRGLTNLLIGQAPPQPWDDDCVYLQVAMGGYFRHKQTEPFFVARDDVMTFFGLGIALGLFNALPLDVHKIGEKTSHFYVHRHQDDSWIEQSALVLDDHYHQGIANLELADEVRNDIEILRQMLSRIGAVFRSDVGKNVALAARWLFDSHCGRDALLRYIQAVVAIEILLGDEEADPSVGLTTLMANRCAFLIAKTPAARTNLLKLFREIYKVRSKIVHRGKSRLNKHEMGLFLSLQMILRMVIDNEQKLLERAEQVRRS